MSAWLAIVHDLATDRARAGVMGAVGTAQGVGVVVANLLSAYLYLHVAVRLPGLHLSSHYTLFFVVPAALPADRGA